jgi:hypothetical protein
MRTRLGLILGSLLLFSQAAMAQTTTNFTVSAVVPGGSGIGVTVNSVNSTGTPVFTPVSGTALNFAPNPLSFNTTTNTYTASNYFTLDVAVTGGSGSPDTTVTYAEGSNPNNSATNGLGSRSSIKFMKEVYTSSSTPSTETSEGYTTLYAQEGAGTHIPYTTVSPGWLRLYVGLCTGNTSTDPANCKAFTATDVSGTYSGTLTISATVN